MKSDDLLLYAVTDRRYLQDISLAEAVGKSIIGGVTFVQLREKNLSGEQILQEARTLKKLCASCNVPFVINDDVTLAKHVDADGVHVGQKDMQAAHARKILGENKIIGVSVQTVSQAVEAQKQGADYLGVGAMFPTDSKNDAEAVSVDTLRNICNAVTIPVVAIGGIGTRNISQLNNCGICGVAVISSIFDQKDIVQAAQDLKVAVKEMLRV